MRSAAVRCQVASASSTQVTLDTPTVYAGVGARWARCCGSNYSRRRGLFCGFSPRTRTGPADGRGVVCASGSRQRGGTEHADAENLSRAGVQGKICVLDLVRARVCVPAFL